MNRRTLSGLRLTALALCLLTSALGAAAQTEPATRVAESPQPSETSLTQTLGEPENPNDLGRGQLLLQGADPGRLYPAPTLDTDVSMQVSGMVARVRVTQSFTNPTSAWLNGIYVFPLPENAAVDRLRMSIGERVIEGEILEKAQARAAYESARDQGRSAALTEQLRPNLFRNSVANIGPGEQVRVTIEYQQTVRYASGRFSLRFPMTVGTRYIPGTPAIGGFDGHGWSKNTDQVPDASQITPPVTHVGQGHDNPVTLTADLDPGLPLAEVTSPYHHILQEPQDGNRVRVRLDGPVPADRDFELVWRPAAADAPQAALFTQGLAGETYGLLMLVPPQLDQSPNRLPRELIFVIDTSGSMSGTSIEQARAALQLGLQGLKPGDSFNLVEFNSTTRALYPASVPADPAHLAEASRFAAGLQADGGTEMAAALDSVLDGREHPDRLRQVLFMTDGAVGNEQALFALIAAKLGDSRLFTVGIGSAPNSHFMAEAAAAGRGTFTYIGAVDEVQERMRELLTRLEYPVLADITLTLDSGQVLDYAPQPLPDLYLQEPLVVSFRTPGQLGAGQVLTVSGRTRGQTWSTRVPLTGGSQASGLDVLWARNRILALERSLARGADPEQVRTEIIRLGLAHRIVTQHTSLVAIDKTPRRPAEAVSQDGQIPVKQPHGWQLALPEPAPAPQSMPDMGSLPQGATPAGLLLWIGSALLGLALMLVTWMRQAGRG